MAYSIELKPAAIRGLAKLPKDVQKSIRSRIDALAKNPFPSDMKKLESEENFYRIKVGDYRIIYQTHKKILLVLVVRIGHRKEVYRRLSG
jgi:mRNA interferase RelE/StbE